ncbi:MAG TPA: oligosaccharide flippase family protein [Candidatus Binataceae bacterium]|nr:oligosaccharide flippase family protein [Candidatus Binataceae bacterium]
MSALHNVKWSYAAWGASALAPLVTVPVCVRYLGPRLYGEWLIILSLTTYLGLTNLGIAQTVGNRIAEAIARGRRDEVQVIVATGFWAYMLIGGVLIVLMLIGTTLVAPHYLGSSTTGISGSLIIYRALICAAMPAKIYRVAMRRFERVDCEQALDAGSTLARINP